MPKKIEGETYTLTYEEKRKKGTWNEGNCVNGNKATQKEQWE